MLLFSCLACTICLCAVDLILVNSTLFHLWANLQEAWWHLVFVFASLVGLVVFDLANPFSVLICKVAFMIKVKNIY